MAQATERISTADYSQCRLSSARKQSLRRKLLAWYRANARDLPWRRSRDPYCVWISEVMLQQTQVATVREYFKRFVRALPDVATLAAADEQDVLRLWEGLGYYRRARQLHAAAQHIVDEYAGRFPQSVEELRRLPGIGRYTAGAIVSIAFDKRAPILEANSIRLISRLIAYRGEAMSAAGQRVLWRVAEEILPRANVAQFNQALMELGSLICTSSEPKCRQCPLSSLCEARLAGWESEIPAAKPRQEFIRLHEAAVIVRKDGRVLMRRCGAGERWAGLWDFPRFGLDSEDPLLASKEIVSKLRAQTGIACASPRLLTTMRHGVTRYKITLDCYQATHVRGRGRARGESAVEWMPLANLAALPLSTTGRKIAKLVSRRVTE
jgi:A/G-specific adenine glycosylase